MKTYIYEAIEVEKAGLEVNFKKNTDFIIPEEFQNKLNEAPALKTAFESLTPGRQRAYLNNPKLESQGFKNICRKFSEERD